MGLALDPAIPIIKRMFTPSYTLFAGGIVLLMFFVFFWLIDSREIRKWSFPLIVVGMNPIFIYVLHRFLGRWMNDTYSIYLNIFNPLLGSAVDPLRAGLVLSTEWLICLWLYKNRIFIKI